MKVSELQIDMDLFRNGDKATFEEVYRFYYSFIVWFIGKSVFDRQAAEDYATDVFIKLLKRRANFEFPVNIKSFLFITANNMCKNHYRHSQVERIYVEEEKYKDQSIQADAFNRLIQSEFLLNIYHAIELLPTQRKKCLMLIGYDGYSRQQVEQILGISRHTIKEHVQKARQFIKAYLSEHDISIKTGGG